MVPTMETAQKLLPSWHSTNHDLQVPAPPAPRTMCCWTPQFFLVHPNFVRECIRGTRSKLHERWRALHQFLLPIDAICWHLIQQDQINLGGIILPEIWLIARHAVELQTAARWRKAQRKPSFAHHAAADKDQELIPPPNLLVLLEPLIHSRDR